MVAAREGVVLEGSSAPHARAAAQRAGALVDGGPPGIPDALALAVELGRTTPRPVAGHTIARWEVLASLGATDLTVARVAEPHLDALAILDEAQRSGVAPDASWPDDATWGVYAAEGGGERLRATRGADGQWRLDGPKPWCSLADQVTHALVTAWVNGDRRLFAMALGQPGVTVNPTGAWVSRGLSRVTSTGLQLAGVSAAPVGQVGWYLRRPGFAWGGAGVAAIWFGATVSLARRLYDATRGRTPDQVALVHLGAVDAALARARAVLVEVGELAESGLDPAQADLTCQRVRQVVADTAHEVLDRVGRALGPGPLTTEEEHARRVADLEVYLRQHHGERDQARLGSTVLEIPGQGAWTWW